MDLKKSKQASLENKRGIYFIIGFLISCSLILISFEWTSDVDLKSELAASDYLDIDVEIMQIIPRDEHKPVPKPELPNVKKVLEIAPDDIELEDYDFSTEVTKNTLIDFRFIDSNPVENIDDDPIPFVQVEDKPRFNGGDPNIEFVRYIVANLIYPEIAAENGVSGRVFVQFDIDVSGKLVDPVILREVHPALDAEAIRVVLSSPKWIPGKQRSKAVKVRYVFPINFVLK